MDLSSVNSGFFGISKGASFTEFLDLANPTLPQTMKSKVLIFTLVVILSSCATPRYSYYFDHQPLSARKQNPIVQEVDPLKVDPALVSASSQGSFIPAPVPVLDQTAPLKSAQMDTKGRSKALITPSIPGEKEIKFMAPAQGGQSKDLRLAAIFGAAGVVALIIGGSPLNVLGGIAILIGLVFFVRWIIRR
jgi:hypothetical protein